jgi:3-phenylpropionate/cinnamic acid dioxygenase small subunit
LLAAARVADQSGQLDVRGADAIEQLYVRTTRRHPETGTPRTKHLITNLIIEIDESGSRAACRSHYTVLQQTAALPLQPIISGRYHHRLERSAATWQIVEHIFFVDLVGDLSQHLLVDLGAAIQRS